MMIVRFLIIWLCLSSGLAQANDCQLLNITPVTFGTINPNLSSIVGVGSITIACTPGTSVAVALIRSTSDHNGPRDLLRQGGFDSMSYLLCFDPACQSVWGDGLGGTAVYKYTFAPGSHSITIPVYGKLLSNPDNMAGEYRDNVIVSFSY